MNEILEQNISWEKIGKHEKSAYKYSLGKGTLSKDRLALTVSGELNFIIPYRDIESIRQEIKNRVKGIKEVLFLFEYKDMILTGQEAASLYAPYLTDPAGVTHVFLNAAFEADVKKKILKEGIEAEKTKKGKKPGSIIKAVEGEIIKMSGITPESGAVAVEGELFKKEERTIKNGKKIVTLLITDNSASICAKAFLTDEKWEEIDDAFKLGDIIRVQGEAELDTFENTTVISMKAIEKGEKSVREDNCEERRVELHAHTKMSALDGLSETEELIKLAAAWKQKAIAITDHGVVQAFPDAARAVRDNKLDIKVIYGVEGYCFNDSGYIKDDGSIDYKTPRTFHIIILAKTREGLRNLYKLISLSHLFYFYKTPRIPKSLLAGLREGLVIGSACEAGEIYRAVLEKKDEKDIEKAAEFYDYLEIQPIENNRFLIENKTVAGEAELRENNIKIVKLGEKLGKPVVATTDAHYIDQGDAILRDILRSGKKKSPDSGRGLYIRTTEEMLLEFGYLGKEAARRVVIESPGKIADMIEDIAPVPEGKYPPKIENEEQILKDKCMERAWSLYGKPLPKEIEDRLLRELNSIISNGYAVMYVLAEMLVKKSLSDGYLVGARGSVGSSFAATMAGITEVNPLPVHYICPVCKHFEWGDVEKYDCCADMDEKVCPDCGVKMDQAGFTIPFETFLGFEGDKEPDIDLNFAGEYQQEAHKYVEEIFGSENVFRAGTISTIQGKTAFGLVRGYFEERGIPINKWETDRLTLRCSGVRQTTGQHPGGVIIVPKDREIYEFCPVQHPADKSEKGIVTTHFDYHAIDQNLLKLDILGHDAPSMLKRLHDITGVDPLSLPFKDAKVNSVFNGTESLGIKDPDYKFTHGSYGIPEFGTRFVRQMLDDTKPEKFADLVRISGFSHGTNVWTNNARDYIKSGIATMDDIISTRDDIMRYLIQKGLPNKTAFKIMENVRRGKGVTEEEASLMRQKSVPDWYIESCNKIKYMFPRAHAVAYVMMSYRIAHYKVYYPLAFYAVYFTTKVEDFDADSILKGPQAILAKINEIEMKGKGATQTEESELTVLEVAYEMYARGFEFIPARIESSEALEFTVCEGKVMLPLSALKDIGKTAANAIAFEYKKKPFNSIEDLKERSRANNTVVEVLKKHGALSGLPESDQFSLF